MEVILGVADAHWTLRLARSHNYTAEFAIQGQNNADSSEIAFAMRWQVAVAFEVAFARAIPASRAVARVVRRMLDDPAVSTDAPDGLAPSRQGLISGEHVR